MNDQGVDVSFELQDHLSEGVNIIETASAIHRHHLGGQDKPFILAMRRFVVLGRVLLGLCASPVRRAWVDRKKCLVQSRSGYA